MKKLLLILSLIFTSISVPMNARATENVSNSERQITCLAHNAYYEARGEPQQGQIAVMNVVMNRVESPQFPSTPCAVVYQGCQFSWVCSGHRSTINSAILSRLMDLARQVYNGSITDVTNGARFFHSRSINPGWRRTRIATIGNHIFYR